MNSPQDRNITWHPTKITKHDRERLNGHRGLTLWFTGLSASGKSTIAREVEDQLYNRGIRAFVLDGDNIRHRLNRDLGFSPEDREENIRRIGEVAHLFSEVGFIAMTAFISPYRRDRRMARDLEEPGCFVEVYCRCPIEICEARDPKGLYKKARAALAAGKGMGFTGVDDPYEAPLKPELVIHNDKITPQEAAAQVLAYLEEKGLLTK